MVGRKGGRQLPGYYAVSQACQRFYSESHHPCECPNLKRDVGKRNKNLVTELKMMNRGSAQLTACHCVIHKVLAAFKAQHKIYAPKPRGKLKGKGAGSKSHAHNMTSQRYCPE